METFEDAILKTVTWWSDKSFRTPLNQNNGDDSSLGGMMFALMNMASMKGQESVTEEKIKLFEAHLAKSLMDYRKEYPTSDIWLDVDYHPCKMLADAADTAGIDNTCFPCKSSTVIKRDNGVVARYQYGSQGIEL